MENSISQINIEPKEVHFEMVGKRPSEQESYNLLRFSLQKKRRFNKEEIKDIMVIFGKTVGKSILLILCGVFIFLIGARADADSDGAMKGLMYLAGIAFGAIGAGFFIYSFIAPFMSKMQKKPENSLLAWLSAILGDDQFFYKNEDRNIEHRIYELDQMLPQDFNIDKEETKQYIIHTRKKIAIAIDEIINKVCETYPQLKHAYIEKKIKVKSVTMANVAEVSAIVTIKNVLLEEMGGSEKKYYAPAIVKLHVKQYFIMTEDFCFPYDVMPEICIQA